MNIDERNKRTGAYVKFRTLFDYVMGLLYLLGGLAVLFAKKLGFDMGLSSVIMWCLGALLVIYGLFRLFRGWKKIF
ncbi:hypothetical protein [Compostibacter hankyongensis]|uniref:Uncharacterized protein n=1 Tax=Compostibacter hankyongensis TaxID=1007089 RepID=A0ABP8FGF9_9BACT